MPATAAPGRQRRATAPTNSSPPIRPAGPEDRLMPLKPAAPVRRSRTAIRKPKASRPSSPRARARGRARPYTEQLLTCRQLAFPVGGSSRESSQAGAIGGDRGGDPRGGRSGFRARPLCVCSLSPVAVAGPARCRRVGAGRACRREIRTSRPDHGAGLRIDRGVCKSSRRARLVEHGAVYPPEHTTSPIRPSANVRRRTP